MSFILHLTDLVARVDNALAALFLDHEGEAIDVAGKGFSVYDFKIIGAYQAIFIDALEQILSGKLGKLGKLERYKVQYGTYRFFICRLMETYYLVLIQEGDLHEGRAWRELAQTRETIENEIA